MSVKCPSCGFDSADGAPWCDMCKQPFNKAKAAPAPAQTTEDLKKASPEDLLKKLAAEEKKVEPAPSWVRTAAWIFLGVWIIFGFILAGIYVARYEDAKNRAPLSHNETD